MTRTVPEIINTLFKEYADVHAPYTTSKKRRQLQRNMAFKGKASIKEIHKQLAKKTDKAVSDHDFLLSQGIGIDCSGFIVFLLDAYSMQETRTHIWNKFKRTTLNPLDAILYRIQPIVSKLNADTLTSLKNAQRIQSIQDIQPMDLIRMSGGKHLVMVHTIYYDEVGTVQKITYIHSTEGIGVCMGTINITDQTKSITSQEWIPLDTGNPRWEPAFLIRYKINNNGVRRPKFLKKKYTYTRKYIIVY